MKIYDLFSKRQKRAREGAPDVFVYDEIPPKLRVQIVHILRDAFASHHKYSESGKYFAAIHAALCREYGLFRLVEGIRHEEEAVLRHITDNEDIEQVLDAVELAMVIVDSTIRHDWYTHGQFTSVTPDMAIGELNARFRESGIGYHFEGGKIIRIDSQVLHAEVVKPVLSLLSGDEFASANDEYLKAFDHYRHGRHEEALNECLKCFESTMKVICTKRKWQYSDKDTAKRLIQIIMDNGLLYEFSGSQLDTMRALLESGIPTARNRLGGHGAGPTQRTIPASFVSYMLHLTGTNVLLLVTAHKGKA